MTETIERLAADTGRVPAPTTKELTPYVAPLTVPPVLRPATDDVLRETEIALRPTWVRLHPQLPPTLMWGYDGQVPGPTIEVRRGRRVRIAWTNRIPKESEYPVTAVEVRRRPEGPQPTTEPGRGGVEPDKDVAALPAWLVTHLHGAQTGGGNDGWTDNAVGPGDAQLSEYPNDHQAVQWWYHDHAMNITRWNVMAGLYGTYLVRDDEEDALHLPSGEREIPLLIADRNIDTDEDGRLNGRLLHKTLIVQDRNPETGKPVSIPFTGPYTTVNGRIWPYAEVDPAWYRFRLVNASNARIFHLVLIDEDGEPVPGIVHQIGSDGGLLPRPVPVDFDAELPDLTAAPAERFDLLIDFRALAGRTLRLVNKGPNEPAGVADAAGDVAYPDVLQFRVRDDCEEDTFELPEVLSGSFRRLTHDIPHGHRLILLTPPATKGGGGHPEIWEMTEIERPAGLRLPADGIVLTLLDRDINKLREADKIFGTKIKAVMSNSFELEKAVLDADLVIGAVLIPGAKAPKLVTNEMVSRMKPGSVLVDIAIDQGGCFEDSRPTTHAEPTFKVHNSVFYCVANMPGGVPNTSTNALTNATLPYIVSLANNGWVEALRRDAALAKGLNTHDGKVVYKEVAEAHGLPHVELDSLLG